MTVAKRDAILAWLDNALDVASFEDYGPQGVQLMGHPDVHKIVAGVSCSMRLFQEAVRQDADMIITHHGLFWNHEPRLFDRMKLEHTMLLLQSGVTLTSYHLPLDAHMEYGNNALLARSIDSDPASLHRFDDIGVGMELRRHMHVSAVEYMLNKHARLALLHKFTDDCPETVQRIAIVTGRGGRYFEAAIKEGYDLFITGEGEEWAQAMSREYGVAFFACGHYNSERLGVEALARAIEEEFRVPWNFIDVPNTV